MILISKLINFVFNLPLFFFYLIKDLFFYIKDKRFKEFKHFNLYLYVGGFGSGKTISAVYRSYLLARQYPDIEILTNINLTNFPEKTVIHPLNTWQDITNFRPPNGGIVLIDEISTIFNSRDFMQKGKEKSGMTKQLFQYIAQNRKNRLLFLGTAQLFEHVDRQIKDFVYCVIKCSSNPANLDFARLTSNTYYDGREYEKARENPLQYPIKPFKFKQFVQSEKIRNLYDTTQLIDTLMTAKYDDDDIILANQCRKDINIGQAPDRKLSKFQKRAMKKQV